MYYFCLSVTRFFTIHKDIYVTAAKPRVDFQYVGKTFVKNVLGWLLSFCLLTSSRLIYTCFKYICSPTSAVCVFTGRWTGNETGKWLSVLINRILRNNHKTCSYSWRVATLLCWISWELQDLMCQRESTWFMMNGLNIKEILSVRCWGIALQGPRKALKSLTFT